MKKQHVEKRLRLTENAWLVVVVVVFDVALHKHVFSPDTCCACTSLGPVPVHWTPTKSALPTAGKCAPRPRRHTPAGVNHRGLPRRNLRSAKKKALSHVRSLQLQTSKMRVAISSATCDKSGLLCVTNALLSCQLNHLHDHEQSVGRDIDDLLHHLEEIHSEGLPRQPEQSARSEESQQDHLNNLLQSISSQQRG